MAADEITAKIFEQDRKVRRGQVVQEAGFVVYNSATSKDLDNRVFTTREEATAAIPDILARIARQIELNEAQAATKSATSSMGGSNAARDRAGQSRGHRDGIGSTSVGLYLPTPTDAHGGCYYCGDKDCTDCG